MLNYNHNDFGIFIVTFSKRFHYLENLLSSLREQTDLDIFININGDYKKTINCEYRDKVLNLCLKHKNVYPRFYNLFRSYAYMCNDFICNGNKLYNIITNDDVVMKKPFVIDFLNYLKSIDLGKNLVIVNNSFSTHCVSRQIVRNNKFYDERFIGLGCEDSDFYHRLLKWNQDMNRVSFEHEMYDNKWAETFNTLIDQNASTVAKYHNFNYKIFEEYKNQSEKDYLHPRPNEDFFFDNYDTFWNYSSIDYMTEEQKRSWEINRRA